MPNQAPLSPARVLFEELRANEDAGSLDTWPAPHQADGRAPAPDRTPPDAAASAASRGDLDRIRIDRVEQIPVDGIAVGDSIRPQSALAAIIRLQSSEIERLALENDRLAVQLSAVHQFHQNEQNQRRNLERQLREASARNEPPAPAFDVEEIRRAAREGMSAEVKPVLVAILSLLESTLPRGVEAEKPAAEKPAAEEPAAEEPAAEKPAAEKPAAEKPVAVVGGAPVSTPADLAAEVVNDFHRLPQILTRPLEELMSGAGNAGSAPQPIADPPAPVPPEKKRWRRPRPPRHEAPPSVMPSAFAWTNLIS